MDGCWSVNLTAPLPSPEKEKIEHRRPQHRREDNSADIPPAQVGDVLVGEEECAWRYRKPAALAEHRPNGSGEGHIVVRAKLALEPVPPAPVVVHLVVGPDYDTLSVALEREVRERKSVGGVGEFS